MWKLNKYIDETKLVAFMLQKLFNDNKLPLSPNSSVNTLRNTAIVYLETPIVNLVRIVGNLELINTNGNVKYMRAQRLLKYTAKPPPRRPHHNSP